MKGRATAAIAWVFVSVTVGCGVGTGSSGGAAPDPGGGTLSQTLQVVTHWPTDNATQIPLTPAIAVRLDAVLQAVCLQDGQTYLEERDSRRKVPGTFELTDQGQTLVFRPSQPLKIETWYRFHLSALLCDTNGRLLEEPVSFEFQTLDQTPPTVAGASVSQQATAVSLTEPMQLTFSEAIRRESITEESVQLADDRGARHPTKLTLDGQVLRISLVGNLAGDTRYTLKLPTGAQAVRDMAGNPIRTPWSVSFHTEADNTAPRVIATWPTRLNQASPHIQPQFTFSESMDPDSIEKSAFQFFDQHAAKVAYTTATSLDKRTIRLIPQKPLQEGVFYSIGVVSGLGAVTDLAGNTLANNAAIFVTVGRDKTRPAVKSSLPANDQVKVSINVKPEIVFTEGLDENSVHERTVVLSDGVSTLPVKAVLTLGNTRLLLAPQKDLDAGRQYSITLAGGPFGIRDTAGNTLLRDHVIKFSTSTDAALPNVVFSPTSGSTVVPRRGKLTAVLDAPLDPKTVNSENVFVLKGSSGAVAGTVSLHKSGRIIEFVPAADWQLGIWHSLILRHGPTGIRKASGNWLTGPASTSFQANDKADITPPVVEVTINSTDVRRNQGLTVPPHGFDINVFSEDEKRFDLDLSSLAIELTGPTGAPPQSDVLRDALIAKDGLTYTLASQHKLQPGNYTLTATTKDLAGNTGRSARLDFKVAAPDTSALPFERTEVVWVRFDMDRDGNGLSDFKDDLLKLGLISPNDPSGTNQYMIDLLREGMLAQGNLLLQRRRNGGRTGSTSIPILLTPYQPHGVPFSRIAVGGLDPRGEKGRQYGDTSTGVLGRAFFDYRNSLRTDDNTVTNPGLGVFSGELFLFQVNIHKDLYPRFVTVFAKRFLKLVSQMGGTPVGQHFLDRRILSSNFDIQKATSQERERWNAIMLAADDWATAVGIILVHEIGHTVGLTATGENPMGLHGGNSLHNAWPGFTDVMTTAVAYETLVALKYRFRDLNMAYLRQRILMK